MYSTSTIDLKILSAEQFRESVSEPAPNTKIYFAFGKNDAWRNEPTPDVANGSVSTIYSFWKGMIGAKKLTDLDIRHVIERHNWSANTVYTQYDQVDQNLYNLGIKFHIINSEYNVYKCISNNNGANSVFEPLTVSTNNTIQTADGYIWKYMYTVSEFEKQRFTTSSFIPVKTLTEDNGSRQWDVQRAAVDGAIHKIVVTNGGAGYKNVSNLVVTVTGDGVGAAAIATINTQSNTVNSIVMTSIGSGYREATVTITGGAGSNATARSIISPKGGHGSNPLYELGGHYLLLNPRFQNIESGFFPVGNEFRQVALISDPYVYNSNTNVSANLIITQTTDLTLVGTSGEFVKDEWIYQGRSLAEATFKGKVVEWNKNTGIIKLNNTFGSPAIEGIVGANSIATRFVSSINYPDLEPYSGRLLYINNITPIIRSRAQTEDFKIIIKF